MIIDNIQSSFVIELELRKKKMQEGMEKEGIDAALITGNANLCYAVGTVVEGYYYLPVEGEALLFIRNQNIVSGKDVYRIRKPEEIPDILRETGVPYPKKLALENNEISAGEWNRLSKVFDAAEISSIPIARNARMIKTDYEVNIYKEDGRRQAALYKEIPSLYEPGMDELAFSAAVEYHLRKAGHIGLFRTNGFRMEAFMGSVMAGDNACAPSPYDFAIGGKGPTSLFPMGQTAAPMENGQTVMVDLSGNFRGYLIDITRTYVIGNADTRTEDYHKIALEIQHAVFDMVEPGVLCSQLYEKALEIAKHNHIEDYFMGVEKKAKFIGHGIGIEINEEPVLSARYNQPLEENMIFALEPKVCIPGVGAVGVENSVLVTSDGASNLTECDESLQVLKL